MLVTIYLQGLSERLEKLLISIKFKHIYGRTVCNLTLIMADSE